MVRVWGFCRDFSQAFPSSDHVPAVEAIRKEAEDAIATTRSRIVLHGHIAVLEPVPRPRELRPSMVPPYAAYLADRVHEEPSNWRLHQALIDHVAAARQRGEMVPKTYEPLARLSVLYPGNEWPFIAAAAYQLRVRGALEEAEALASKALILNPASAKAHALRGFIRMGMPKEHDGAAADLARAAKLDPKALGDEPETPRAAAFLIRKTREAGNARQARAYGKALADLQPLHISHPIDDYRALIERP
jgi:tetratricopeptide (TPR) repeat protein